MTAPPAQGPPDSPPGAAPGQVGALRRLVAPFGLPAYRLMAVALACGAFAYGAWTVALVWEVIRLGGGPSELSFVSTAGALGVVAPALLAGVVADRVPQKLVVMLVAAIECACYAVVATLSLLGGGGLVTLAVVAFVLGAGMAFYYAAYSAWLPAIVPASQLQAVNGFEGMVRPLVTQALGPAAAGVVVGVASPGLAAALAAVVAGIGVVVQVALPRTPVRRVLTAADGHPVASAARDVAEGVRYLLRTRWLLATLLFASLMVLAVMGPLEVLVPFVVKDRLGGDAGDHALVLAAFGVGGAAGSLAMAAVPMPRRYLTWMNLMWGTASLPLVLMGFAPSVAVLALAAFALGALLSAPSVIWGTLLQRRVPPDLLGRVASLDFLVSVALMPVSMALAGPVSEAVGLTPTFVVAGVAPVAFAGLAIWWGRLPADELAHPMR